MDNEVKLSINTSSLIMSKKHNSLAMSVFQTCKDNIMAWILNYYIDVINDPASLWQYDFYIKNPWFTAEGLTESNNMTFYNDAFNYKSLDIIYLIKNMLSKGYYVRGDYNTYYIPVKKSYMKVNHNTEYLIVGYSEEKKVFYILDKTINSDLEIYELTYGDYQAAIANRTDKKFNLNFIYVYRDFDNSIKPLTIKDSLINYLYSILLEKEKNSTKIYGANCFKQFVTYIRKMSEIYNNIDIRYAKFFVEHKNFMQMRMHCLYDLGSIKNMDIIQNFDDIYTDALTVYNLINAYNEKHNYKDAVSIDLMISDINKREKNALKVVIDLMNHDIEEARTNTK